MITEDQSQKEVEWNVKVTMMATGTAIRIADILEINCTAESYNAEEFKLVADTSVYCDCAMKYNWHWHTHECQYYKFLCHSDYTQ